MSFDGRTTERFVAQSAIRDKLHQYALLAKEEADFAAMVPLWVKGGTFTLPNGHVVGADQIQTIVATGQPNFIRHHITTVGYEFPADDLAYTDTYFIAYTDIAQPDHWGRWKDRLRRQENGEWLFENKSVIIEGWAKISFWADLMARLGH
ncbi:hypothetical protein [Ancylobacter sp. IITR112]|uniref:hypothetical protein n=1 Tax=Ancylobacter sp. IITR112 TaxID=3138073 RepID=UPI00352B61A9